MFLTAAKRRYGFPRSGSNLLLTDPIDSGERLVHRYSYWQQLAKALGFDLPAHCVLTHRSEGEQIVIHTGASQPVRVWPLERYARLVGWLRHKGYMVQVLCDANQFQFWQEQGEAVVAPRSLTELSALLERAAIFVGNDSGAGHLAAVSGIPTFTIFGNQYPAVFAPIHPASEWIEGAPCRYKPCHDKCAFPVRYCLTDLDEERVCKEVELFAVKTIQKRLGAGA
jgi:ADP-heptose:LPS heptosyltransferase